MSDTLTAPAPFDMKGLMSQAIQGQLPPPAPPPGSGVSVAPPTSDIQSAPFDMKSLMQKAVKGQLPSDKPALSGQPRIPPPQIVERPMQEPIGVLDSGAPIFPDDASNSQTQGAVVRVGEKGAEGATFGMLPYGVAGVRALGGTPFQQGLQEARNYSAETSKEVPLASGIAQGVGSLGPVAGVTSLAKPVTTALEKGVPYVGRLLGQTFLGSGVGAANSAGQDIGSGNTQNLGADVQHGATVGGLLGGGGSLVGSALQGSSNVVRSGLAAGRGIFTDAGKDATAGQVLREATGGPDIPTMARSPIPGMDLRTAQATGNRGIAELERSIAPPDVQNGRMPAQTKAVVGSLVGSDAGIEPVALTNQASSRGVQAINSVDTALGATEKKLWGDPALKSVQLHGPDIAMGVAQDVAAMPASWRDAVTGPQAKLGAYLRELEELGPQTSIAEINSVRSRLLRAARDAGSGANPDSVTAAAANSMAGNIVDRMGADPAMTGPAATAYQAARAFSREYHQTLGYNEFNAILNPNRQGNIQGNEENQFGRFFDLNGGTQAGLERLQQLHDFAVKAGATDQAQELADAANQYLKASVVRQARAGNGIDQEGQPAMNLATMASTANKTAPAISGTPMVAGSAPDVQAAGNAAELLNRANQRGDYNSTTFEKLKNRDLVASVLGQSGGSALGAVGGAYGGYEYGPESVPWWLRVPAGAAAGAVAGKAMSPMLGKVVAHVPGGSAVMEGPTKEIMRRVEAGLASPVEYQRLMRAMPQQGPALSASGQISGAVTGAAQAAVPTATNPKTGLPEYSLKANQQQAEAAQPDVRRQKIGEIITGLRDGTLADPKTLQTYISARKQELRPIFGGQGMQNVQRAAALMRRPNTVFAAALASKALKDAGINDAADLAGVAMLSPEISKMLATNTNRPDLSRAGERQILNALQMT